MSVTHDLMVGAVFLLPVGATVGLLAVFGSDRTADEHDLSDYHAEPTAELVPRRHTPAPAVPAASRPGAAWPLLDRKPIEARRALRPLAPWDPTPAGADGPVPPLARALLIAQAVPTLSDAAVRGIADEWLREIAAEQQARAGIVRVLSPATDRDLTGAFAVVAVA